MKTIPARKNMRKSILYYEIQNAKKNLAKLNRPTKVMNGVLMQ